MAKLEHIRKVLEDKGVKSIVCYTRKSREVTEEEVQKHKDIMDELADGLGYPIEFKYEIGSSETLNRPILNQIIEDITKKKILCLMVYRLDRLSRKTTDMERLINKFEHNGLILIEAHKREITNYKDKLAIKFESMLADLSLEATKKILAGGRSNSVLLYGHHFGVCPLGYSRNELKKNLQPNGESWIVKDIYNLYLKGYSTHSIALKLNEQGLTTSSGQQFKGKGIWDILHNDVYIGVQTYGKRSWNKDENGKKHCNLRPKDEWIVYKDAHDSIIDTETFYKVQQELEKNRTAPTGVRNRKFSMTSLVKCGKCGWSMSAIVREYKDYKTPMFRSCYRRNYMTGARCGNGGLSMKEVEEYAKEQIWQVVRHVVLKTSRQMSKDKKSLVSDKEKQLKDLVKKEHKLNKNMNNLIDMQMESGKNENIMIRMRQVEVEKESIRKQIERLEESNGQYETLLWVEQYLKSSEDLVGFPVNIKGKSAEDLNIFYKKYIESITVLEGEITGIKFQPEVERLLGFGL